MIKTRFTRFVKLSPPTFAGTAEVAFLGERKSSSETNNHGCVGDLHIFVATGGLLHHACFFFKTIVHHNFTIT